MLDGAGRVTLVGVGGVGKTRVALAVAERIGSCYDLAVAVDLSEVSDDKDVMAAVARTLGVSSPTIDAVGVALSGRRALLVLDNCEHVLDAVADLVVDVLDRSPIAQVLATSREGLRIDASARSRPSRSPVRTSSATTNCGSSSCSLIAGVYPA